MVEVVLREEDTRQAADGLEIAGGVCTGQTHLAAGGPQFTGQQLKEDIRSTVNRTENAGNLTSFDLQRRDLEGDSLPEDLLQVGNFDHKVIVALFMGRCGGMKE